MWDNDCPSYFWVKKIPFWQFLFDLDGKIVKKWCKIKFGEWGGGLSQRQYIYTTEINIFNEF